jgi:hypothetical protein
MGTEQPVPTQRPRLNPRYIPEYWPDTVPAPVPAIKHQSIQGEQK